MDDCCCRRKDDPNLQDDYSTMTTSRHGIVKKQAYRKNSIKDLTLDQMADDLNIYDKEQFFALDFDLFNLVLVLDQMIKSLIEIKEQDVVLTIGMSKSGKTTMLCSLLNG